MLRNYANLVDQVAVYELSFATGLAELPLILDYVQQIIQDGTPRHITPALG